MSCAHCNNIKSDKYDPIIDCTKENVEERIAFRKNGYFGTNERLEFEALDTKMETKNTIELLKEVYYGTTPQKQMEAKIIKTSIQN